MMTVTFSKRRRGKFHFAGQYTVTQCKIRGENINKDIRWTFERHSTGSLCGCPEFQMKTVIAWYNFLSESKKKKNKKILTEKIF